MARVLNFSAGPAALPVPVLQQAQADMLDWHGNGASVMELSHRGQPFMDMAAEVERDLRVLVGIPDEYAVLFLQGGATQHFAQIPMNLARPDERAEYVISGHWSDKAAKEAAPYVKVHIAASSAEQQYRVLPPRAQWDIDPKAAYLHYTPNETIHGVEYPAPPEVDGVPLVADMSSNILSRPVDVTRFGIIYAGAQKNIGPSGLVVVIIRRDLLARDTRPMANILRYARQEERGSMLNTPNTWGWYVAGLTLKWLASEGGMEAIGQRNRRKAETLYAAIDGSGGFYRNEVDKAARSRMNVPFQTREAELDALFVKESVAAGMIGLKGHRVVGGMRASLYNAVTQAAVQTLVDFMHEFQHKHG